MGDGARQLDAEEEDEEHGDAERGEAEDDRPVRLARGRRDTRRREIVLCGQHLGHLPPNAVDVPAALGDGDRRARDCGVELGDADQRLPRSRPCTGRRR